MHSALLIFTYLYTLYGQYLLTGNHQYSDPYHRIVLSVVNFLKMESYSIYFCVWPRLLNVLFSSIGGIISIPFLFIAE